jgi:hypothetical protein
MGSWLSPADAALPRCFCLPLVLLLLLVLLLADSSSEDDKDAAAAAPDADPAAVCLLMMRSSAALTAILGLLSVIVKEWLSHTSSFVRHASRSGASLCSHGSNTTGM